MTARLAAIQALIAESPDIDSLLLVGGVDGRNHAGSREALDWLFSGLSGREIWGSKHDNALDEAVLLITADAARLYAPPKLWAALQPRVARWRRLQVWSPPVALEDDVEQVEEHKIRSFIAMASGVGRVGVALPPAEGSGKGPAAAIELWPLVQAFALQDFEALTGGGFFTQQHEVTSVAEALRALQLQLDAPALGWLRDVEAPRLAGCLADCLQSVDVACDGGRAVRLSEAELFEPALTYHAHGKLRERTIPSASAVVGEAPLAPAVCAAPDVPLVGRVSLLVGGRTALLGDGPKTSCSAARAGEAGGPELLSRHLCCEVTEPLGPLYAGRSYFLSTGARAPPHGTDEAAEELIDADESAAPPKRKTAGLRATIAAAAAAADTSGLEDALLASSDLLQGLYGALVGATDHALAAQDAAELLAAAASGTSDASGPLFERILSGLVVRAARAQLATSAAAAPAAFLDASSLATRLQVSATCVDALGSSYSGAAAAAMAAAGRLLVQLRVVLSLQGVERPTSGGGGTDAPLGGLLYGQTYTAVASAKGGGVVALTAGVPTYEAWRAHGPEAEASTDLTSACVAAATIAFGHLQVSSAAGSLQPRMPEHPLVGGLLGQPIADPIDGIALLSPHSAVQPLPVLMYAYERGAVLSHPRLGAMLLLFDVGMSPRRVELYEHEGALSYADAAAAADADADADAAVAESDVLFEDSLMTIRLFYQAEQLPLVLGSRASLYVALSTPPAEPAQASDPRALFDVTLGVTRGVARRLLRRTVVPAWREQWAKRGVEVNIDAPVPRAPLLALPTSTLSSTWPTRAAKAVTRAVAALPPPTTPSAAAARVDDAALDECPFMTGVVTGTKGRQVSVLLLVGLPGTTLTELGAGAVDLSSSSAAWLPAPDPAAWVADDGRCDAHALATALKASLAAGKAGGGSLPECVLVTTRGLAEMPSAARAVVQACAAVRSAAGAGGLQLGLGAAVACVDAPRVFESWAADGDVRCAPGVLELLDDGYTQAVVACHMSELDSAKEASLSKLFAATAPHAALIRAPRGARAAGATVAAMVLPSTASAGSSATHPSMSVPAPFYAPAMVAARAVSGGWAATRAAAATPNPALDGVLLLHVPPPPPVALNLLVPALAARCAKPANAPAPGAPHPAQILLLYGSLRVLGAGADASGAAVVNLDASAGTVRPPVPSAQAEPTGLTVLCRGLTSAALAEILLGCRPLPPRQPLYTLATLPAEHTQAVKDELRDHAPLPEDIFYDGRSYVSFDGTRSELHPGIDVALAKLLGEMNDGVRKANAFADEAAANADADGKRYLATVA